jgi:Mn2+/Fe2+ NRAMP family transporter
VFSVLFLMLNEVSIVQNMFEKSRSTIYGLALLASGQSCALTTSYSGQYIMQVSYKQILPPFLFTCHRLV